MADETFRSVPVSHSSAKAPPSESGAAARMMTRRRKRPELHDEHQEDQRRRDGRDQQQLAERPLLRFVLAADFPRVADGQRHGRQHVS